jgi:hypothetical protein
MQVTDLPNDCTLLIISYLDYNAILLLGRVSRFFYSITNTASIWLRMVHERMKREYTSKDPKLLFRKSLRAGLFMQKCIVQDNCVSWYSVTNELRQRDDIIRTHYFQALTCHFLACITLEGRCIIHTNYNEKGKVTRDVGEADDVLLHADDEEDKIRLYAVLLKDGKVRVLSYQHADLDHAEEFPVLPNVQVKELLGIVDLNLVCMLEDNSVVLAPCLFSSILVLATQVASCFVYRHEFAITHTPGTKYVRNTGILQAGYIDIRCYLEKKRLTIRKYGYGFDTQVIGKKRTYCPDARLVQKDPLYKFIAHIEVENVDNVWITDSCVVTVLCAGRIFTNTNKFHVWNVLDEKVLWVRTTNSNNNICYIVSS